MSKIKKIIGEFKEKGFSSTMKHIRSSLKNIVFFKVTWPLEKKIMKLIGKVTGKKALKNSIVIESHNDFDCNGGAFYNYLIEQGYNKKYQIVWLIKNKLRKKLPANVNAYKLTGFSLGKCCAIARAKYILSDDFITEKIREDQKTFYCTHGGCTFKNVKGLIVVPDSIDYILSSSESYDPYICDNFSIPYPNNRMLHLGYPSNDVLFNTNIRKVEQIMHRSYKKTILWMPTFRKSCGMGFRVDTDKELELGIPMYETVEQVAELNKYLVMQDSLLVIKLHPRQDLSSVDGLFGFSNILVLTGDKVKELGIDTYELMAEADALLSDYSSSAYSYILTNRPVGFVLADINDYKLGFSVEDIDRFLPGDKIYTAKDMERFIQNVLADNDYHKEERTEFLKWLYEFQDDKASERLAEFMEL